MWNSVNIPAPFVFNDLKHHRDSQIERIVDSRLNTPTKDLINQQLLRIGNSMIDLYFGPCSVQQICAEISEQLKMIKRFEQDHYMRFLDETKKKYRIMDLNDGSSWTLLIGREDERYLHIHPSRASKYTIRVRATALKTAILLLIYCNIEDLEKDLVNQVNKVRKLFLMESPIKNESYTKGLKRVLQLLKPSLDHYMHLRSSR